MSAKDMNRYLTRILLDIHFREFAAEKSVESFEGYDLSEEEKMHLQNMGVNFFENLPASMKDPAFRVGIIRSILTTERTVERVAMVPPLGKPSNTPTDQDLTAAIGKIKSSSDVDRTQNIKTLLDMVDPVFKKEVDPEPSTPAYSLENPDIFIVGLGINGFDQVTPETIRAISQSNETFFIGNGMGTEEYIASLCPKATNLMGMYQEDGDRNQSYRDMAIAVISAALSHPPVTLAEYGHPIVFSMPPFIIESLAKPLGLTVKVYPAVSAMDCILSELMIDPCSDGMLTYEATDLLIRRRSILPDVGLLIWQAGSVETSLYSSKGSKPERFFGLTSYLLDFYPPFHEVTAIYASNYPLIPSTVYRFPLAQLPDLAEKLHPGFTLYIKPSAPSATKDYKLAHLSRSTAHLNRISAGENDK